MQDKKKALKAAFPYTIPVLTGFLFLGFAYGILMSTNGYAVGWSILMSIIVYAGSGQYVAVTFLTSVFNPIYALAVTLMVNARHLFYGISMLEEYRDAGKLKPYLIYALTDETFFIIHTSEPPEDVDRNWFNFFITLLNHSYWVLGTALGGIAGSMISFDTKGLDFVLTALFVVTFVGQWKYEQNRPPASIGVVSSVVCLIIFGPSNFIIPAMVSILVILTILKDRYQDKNNLIEGEIK